MEMRDGDAWWRCVVEMRGGDAWWRCEMGNSNELCDEMRDVVRDAMLRGPHFLPY